MVYWPRCSTSLMKFGYMADVWQHVTEKLLDKLCLLKKVIFLVFSSGSYFHFLLAILREPSCIRFSNYRQHQKKREYQLNFEPLTIILGWYCSYWIFQLLLIWSITRLFYTAFHIVLTLTVHSNGSDRIYLIVTRLWKLMVECHAVLSCVTVFPRVVSLDRSCSCSIYDPWVILRDTIKLISNCMPMIRNYTSPSYHPLLTWPN